MSDIDSLSLTRPVKPAVEPITAIRLRMLLKEYGLKRRSAAELMGVSAVCFARYCLPPTSKHALRIPVMRWDYLNMKIEELTKDKAAE